MAGRGNRRDEGSFTVSNSNVFAALESLRKKKKSAKEKLSSKGSKAAVKGGGAGKSNEAAEEEKQVYWAPAPLTVKSWADVDDEDDDDYYATTAPPQAMWGGSGSHKVEESHKTDVTEESESEDELLDEVDDEIEDEHETEPQHHVELVEKQPVEVPPTPKEAERQLSKKERRKKELAELEAILADFGVNSNEKAEEEQPESSKNRKEIQLNGDEDKGVVADSKAAKKKKKKDKASKEEKEPQAPNEQEEAPGAEPTDNTSVDVKERLKKVAAPAKKKKSNKDMDGAARAAAMEAAARSAKVAAAKKKEKNHYNQQPTR